MVIRDTSHSVKDTATQLCTDEVCYQSCEQCVSRHVSMCSVLEDAELHTIADISKTIETKAKQQVCAEGEAAEHLFNIKKGCIRISKMLADGRRQIIGFLFPGDFFGLACSNGYSYTAETITDAELCRMPRSEIIAKFSELPALGEKVLNITHTELQKTQDQMLLLGRKRAKEKLVSFLLNIWHKSPASETNADHEIYLPMSRSDIADYLGLTIETVSRQFTQLSKDKLISITENQFVKILDLRKLERIASGE